MPPYCPRAPLGVYRSKTGRLYMLVVKVKVAPNAAGPQDVDLVVRSLVRPDDPHSESCTVVLNLKAARSSGLRPVAAVEGIPRRWRRWLAGQAESRADTLARLVSTSPPADWPHLAEEAGSFTRLAADLRRGIPREG